MSYPDLFLRGVSDKNMIDENGELSGAAFFSQIKPSAPAREDNCNEESICWNDDERAIIHILSQTKEDGNIQFKIGTAILDRKRLDHIMKLENFKDVLSYERKPLKDNQYHGNILLKKDVSKIKRQVVGSHIAGCWVNFIYQETRAEEVKK